MRRGFMLLVAGLLATAVLAQPDRAALAERARAAVDAYRQLVKELEVKRAPAELLDFNLVTENTERLGERLEPLSRLALRLDNPQADVGPFIHELELFENDLRSLECLALPLRLWTYWQTEGVEKPEWAFALADARGPLPRQRGAFNGQLTRELQVALRPGAEHVAQVLIVPLTKDLEDVKATAGDLKGSGGTIPARLVDVLPVDYERLPAGQSVSPDWWRSVPHPFTPQVARDLSQAYVVRLRAPEDLKPGVCEGVIRFSARHRHTLELRVKVTVPEGQAEATRESMRAERPLSQ